MTSLVIITIAGISFQFGKMFLEQQKNQIKNSIITDAERAKTDFERTIETWKSQITVTLPTLRGIGTKTSAPQIENFVNSSGEFVSFNIYRVKQGTKNSITNIGGSFTKSITDQRWGGGDPQITKKQIDNSQISFLKSPKARSKVKNLVVIDSLSADTKLPLVMVATRFDVKGTNDSIWGILTTWQTELINALPKSSFVVSKIIDNRGKVFTSHNELEMTRAKRAPKNSLIIKTLNSKSPSGFQEEYVTNKRRTLGAFAKINDYGLYVVIERDAEKVYETLKKNFFVSGLWAALFVLFATMASLIGATGITKRLRAVTYATTRIAAGDFGFFVPSKSRDEVGVLSHSINLMSSKITHLLNSQVQKARIEQELETARIVQSSFFPKKAINEKHLKISGFYQPASECGGDLWGHYNISEGVDFIYIADATGHGAPAALVTAIAYSTTTTIGEFAKLHQSTYDNPSVILERLNKIIFDAVEGAICMTFFAVIIDTNKGTMTFSNAGHNFPILLGKESGDDRAKKVSKSLKKISDIAPISLIQKGAPLGLERRSKFKNSTMKLKKGDKIFLFTDGLIECQSPDNSIWGRKVLLEHVLENTQFEGNVLKDNVLSRAFEFFADKPLDDDVTVVVAELDSLWEPSATTFNNNTSEKVAKDQTSKSIAMEPNQPVNELDLFVEPEINEEPLEEIPPIASIKIEPFIGEIKKSDTDIANVAPEETQIRPNQKFKIKFPKSS